MNTTPKTARQSALESLEEIEYNGKYSNLEVNAVLRRNELSESDRALYTRLVYGVTEKRITLDYIASQYSETPVEGLDRDVRGAIRLGLYQMLFMDRIPDYSAVYESVALVPKSRSSYVNAVLRAFTRNGKKWKLPADADKRLEVKYSVPRELCAIYKRACPNDTEVLLDALSREPKIALRLNGLRGGNAPDGCVKSKIAPDVVLCDTFTDEIRDGVERGLWFVQDEASRIASAALEAQPGETVIDTCACPGGKSFSLGIDMENRGGIYSFDLHKSKLSLVDSGAEKLGVSIIKTAEANAKNPKQELLMRADRVLCDAPCSGLGVIAKKPEIRYKSPDDIARLPEVQLDILSGSSEYVRVGGVLLYSTCTLNPDENEGVLKAFLAEHGEFELEGNKYLPDGMKTFLPHKDGCDGFFAARMVRRK